MKKLSKNDTLVKTDHSAKLTEAWDQVAGEYSNVEEAITQLNKSIENYNSTLADVQTWRDEIVSQMDEYYSDKSEKWQEGESGTAYEAWKEEWEGLDLEPIDQMDMPDTPEASHSDELDGLSEEPSE